MTNQDAQDLNAIAGAIGWLRETRSIIDGQVYGTADPKHDMVEKIDTALSEADSAYTRIANKMR